MIESIEFANFRVLRDTKLPLGRLTVIVGANGTGKSTAIEAIDLLAVRQSPAFQRYVTLGSHVVSPQEVVLEAVWVHSIGRVSTVLQLTPGGHRRDHRGDFGTGALSPEQKADLDARLLRIRRFSFQASNLKAATQISPKIELTEHGDKLGAVLDRLRDDAPERFEALNEELGRWIPEFDKILFETMREGHKQFALRQRKGGKKIPAEFLSDGTVFALGILALAYLPQPPFIVCIEDPDHGMHPRLLRDVRDALYRLAHPEDFDDAREPVQVVATTHSPFFLNMFKDHPEEIVIAEKLGNEAKFVRLVDLPNIGEILRDSDLGDVWYTGILGGVPTQ